MPYAPLPPASSPAAMTDSVYGGTHRSGGGAGRDGESGIAAPGAASFSRPSFAVYVTRGGPGPMTTQPFLRVGGL
jgi:hypothetical protein